jgi:hypothetical protein
MKLANNKQLYLWTKNMPDYSICYKKAWNADSLWPTIDWDVFLSAFNSSDRVRRVCEKACAKQKHWFISPEYGYSENELPVGDRCFVVQGQTEAELVGSYFLQAGFDLNNTRLCIDITGFMRPHLLFLLKYLLINGVKRFDALYSEPLTYSANEMTKFSDEIVVEVRQIAGFEGNHIPDTSNDVLVIGSGYDNVLIAHVAESKENARKLQLLGLPSLRADMYQENVLRAQRASEQLGSSGTDSVDTFFAPANDPFVTANALSDMIERENCKKPITNLYLCPLATKVQVLGFGLYYLTEMDGLSASIIFPFCKSYARETSVGLSRTWLYHVEFLTN